MRPPLLVFLTLLISACASAAGPGSGVSDQPLERQDILNAQGENAFEILEELRPLWLLPPNNQGFSGDPVRVVIPGRPNPGMGDLRAVPAERIERIEYLKPREARLRLRRFGGDDPRGAIVVHFLPSG